LPSGVVGTTRLGQWQAVSESWSSPVRLHVSAMDALISDHDWSESALGWPVERRSSRIFSG
jgi:hypothetical protein